MRSRYHSSLLYHVQVLITPMVQLYASRYFKFCSELMLRLSDFWPIVFGWVISTFLFLREPVKRDVLFSGCQEGLDNANRHCRLFFILLIHEHDQHALRLCFRYVPLVSHILISKYLLSSYAFIGAGLGTNYSTFEVLATKAFIYSSNS